MGSNTIELIARAVIIHDGSILLCKGKTLDNYYFPGGHVEFNEDSREALIREIKEETGAVVTNTRFIGAVENQFAQEGIQKHEINMVFEAELVSSNIQNLEDHIECMWVPLEEFKKGKVLPETLKEKVIQWMKDKQL